MGLIREIQGITATINKNERAKREREQRKILIENYNAELYGNLRACFYQAFKLYPPEVAEKNLLENKEQNIDKITNIIENITHKENNKTYYTYKNQFDVYTDLSVKYYTELQKFKKEYYQLEKLQQKDTKTEYTTKLYNKLLKYYIENKTNLTATSNVLHRFENIEIIIDSITSDNQIKQFLITQYINILNNVEKLFKNELQHEKAQIKQQERLYKMNVANKIKKDFAFIYMMKKLNKFLQQNRQRKKRR